MQPDLTPEFRELLQVVRTLSTIVETHGQVLKRLGENHYDFVAAIGKQLGFEAPKPAIEDQATIERAKRDIEELEKLFGERSDNPKGEPNA